jgi:mannitol 2-dehydrogenase
MENTAIKGTDSKTVKLCERSLKDINPKVTIPSYDRSSITEGILHMSVGGFHRAHQALYLDDLFQKHGVRDWGVCGAGLLMGDKEMRDALNSQDCLYTVVERSGDASKARVVGSMQRYLFAPPDPEVVIEKMASPEIRIVTLTVTEKGYCVDQVTGEFDKGHPDIVHDLENPKTPVSVIGYLAEGLNRRYLKGIGPFTVLSCDNLQGNGDVVRKMVLEFTARLDPNLSEWISANCAFPNSMVDRITPVTTDGDRSMLREQYGLEDRWPVVCEPFRQWVIEDKFCTDRPNWEAVGVQMTSDVHPYEKIKIRLLNSSHSAMAYLGYLAGYRYIHEVAADQEFREFILGIMKKEVAPLLDKVPGMDLSEYQQTLLTRFANPAIGDQIARIAMDGSQKFPKFMFPSVREQLERGGPIRGQCLAIAGWIRYLQGIDEQREPIKIDDPIADKLKSYAQMGGPNPRKILSISDVFGEDLPKSSIFVGQLEEALQCLYTKGARATLRDYLR